MKKLMFVAALIASSIAVADVSDFAAEDGVYNLTFSQKYLQPTVKYQKELSGDDIEAEGETKAEALKAATDIFEAEILSDEDTYPNARVLKTTYTYDADVGYTCTLKWRYNDPESKTVSSAKLVTITAAGLFVKGNYDGYQVTDGACLLWSKSKDNRVDGKYQAKPYEDITLIGSTLANKAAASIQIPVTVSAEEEEVDLCIEGVGFGTATGYVTDTTAEDYRTYRYVKNISGQILTCTADGSVAPGQFGYGTWKLAKDATATKLANQGYPLSWILYKKGAVEIEDVVVEDYE